MLITEEKNGQGNRLSVAKQTTPTQDDQSHGGAAAQAQHGYNQKSTSVDAEYATLDILKKWLLLHRM